MQRDDSDPQAHASAYANASDDAPPRASISAPISPQPQPKPRAAPPAGPKPFRDWNARILSMTAVTVALIAMAYNTWRNETTEAQRNIRQACFILLEESAAFQQLVELRFDGHDRSAGTRTAAWGKAALIRDIGELAPPRTGQEAQHVYTIWSQRAHEIDEHNPLAEDELSDAIERLRRQTLDDLRELD